MSDARKDVAKLINLEESRAISMHYCGHALNLAVGDCMKSSKICKDTLDTFFKITKLFLSREMQHMNEFNLAIKTMAAPLEFVLSVIPDRLSMLMLLRVF